MSFLFAVRRGASAFRAALLTGLMIAGAAFAQTYCCPDTESGEGACEGNPCNLVNQWSACSEIDGCSDKCCWVDEYYCFIGYTASCPPEEIWGWCHRRGEIAPPHQCPGVGYGVLCS